MTNYEVVLNNKSRSAALGPSHVGLMHTEHKLRGMLTTPRNYSLYTKRTAKLTYPESANGCKSIRGSATVHGDKHICLCISDARPQIPETQTPEAGSSQKADQGQPQNGCEHRQGDPKYKIGKRKRPTHQPGDGLITARSHKSEERERGPSAPRLCRPNTHSPTHLGDD